jgi:hypothetical protein
MSHLPEAPRPSVLNAITGDVSGFAVLAGTVNDGVHVHLPARPALDWPHRCGHVPPQAASFQRRAATDTVARTVSAANAAVRMSDGPVSVGVLSGLGGVGKTQLAIDYAENAWAAGDLDLLVWITVA